MKICIDMGHTPTSPGAGCYLDELTEDRIIGAKLITELESRGHTVVNTTPPDWMAYPDEIDYRVGIANGSGADVFCSIHLNAGGGTGTEVLYFNGDSDGLAWATQISANVASVLGLPDRGPKARTNEIGVIRDTWMTAVLVEVCFVDHTTDKAQYDATSYEAIVNAIADGLESKGVSSGSSTTVSTPTQTVTPAGGSMPEIRYCVHTWGGSWLPVMEGWHDTGGSSDTWAGNGSPIDYISIDMPGWYQVRTEASGWLDKVYKYDPNDLVNGAAGDGSPILNVRCWYETPDPDSTGYYQIEYSVANVGCDFLPNMIDLTDTGGSADDYAGNGNRIGRFRARLAK